MLCADRHAQFLFLTEIILWISELYACLDSLTEFSCWLHWMIS